MASSHDDRGMRFDGASRTEHSDQQIPPGGVPRALREAAERCGLDPLSQLYNEALGYASEGHLRFARERLQMLLCMAPDDGESRLLLAKVYTAGQRWQDALSALDEAEACGQRVPLELRERVEHEVAALRAVDDTEQANLRARDRGEIKELRAEARRLRVENTTLQTDRDAAQREVRKWAMVTTGVSVLTILFIVTTLVFGGRSQSPAITVETPAQAEQLADAAAVGAPSAAPTRSPNTAPAAPVDDASVAGRAAAALAAADELEDTHLEVIVDGGKALLVGQVQSARQRAHAARILADVEGIREVGTDRVEVLARTKGTVHTVARGETLSHIAMHYYGTVALAKRIANANPGSRTLHIGDELKIPPVD